VHFVIEFDQPIKNMGSWIDDKISHHVNQLITEECTNAGVFIEFDQENHSVVQVRSGISMVSLENAALNLKTEVTDTFNWDFEAIRKNQVSAWNDIFDRVAISTNDRTEKA